MKLNAEETRTLLFFIIIVVLVVQVIRIMRAKNKSAGKGGTSAQAPGKTLAQALKDHRTRCNLTQGAVAKALGVSPQLVNQWETGEADPAMANLNALAQVYGVTLAQLLQGVR